MIINSVEKFNIDNNVFFTGSCNETLGLESGDILDEHITASSSFDSHNTGPQNAR